MCFPGPAPMALRSSRCVPWPAMPAAYPFPASRRPSLCFADPALEAAQPSDTAAKDIRAAAEAHHSPSNTAPAADNPAHIALPATLPAARPVARARHAPRSPWLRPAPRVPPPLRMLRKPPSRDGAPLPWPPAPAGAPLPATAPATPKSPGTWRRAGSPTSTNWLHPQASRPDRSPLYGQSSVTLFPGTSFPGAPLQHQEQSRIRLGLFRVAWCLAPRILVVH